MGVCGSWLLSGHGWLLPGHDEPWTGGGAAAIERVRARGTFLAA